MTEETRSSVPEEEYENPAFEYKYELYSTEISTIFNNIAFVRMVLNNFLKSVSNTISDLERAEELNSNYSDSSSNKDEYNNQLKQMCYVKLAIFRLLDDLNDLELEIMDISDGIEISIGDVRFNFYPGNREQKSRYYFVIQSNIMFEAMINCVNNPNGLFNERKFYIKPLYNPYTGEPFVAIYQSTNYKAPALCNLFSHTDIEHKYSKLFETENTYDPNEQNYKFAEKLLEGININTLDIHKYFIYDNIEKAEQEAKKLLDEASVAYSNGMLHSSVTIPIKNSEDDVYIGDGGIGDEHNSCKPAIIKPPAQDDEAVIFVDDEVKKFLDDDETKKLLLSHCQ